MRGLVMLSLLLLAGCAGGEVSCGLRPVAEVKVALTGNVPLMVVEANGQLATMVLDTGAQRTLFTQKAVQRMGLKIDPKLAVTISGVGGSTQNRPAFATRFGIGGIALPDQRVLVLPYSLPVIGGEEVDGLLGADVLGHYEVDLDLPHRRVGLYAGQPCAGEALPMPGEIVAFPSAGRARERMTVELRLDGAPMRGLLDTGAASTVVTLQAMERAGTPQAALAADREIALHGAGPNAARAWVHRFALLELAGERFARPVLQVTASPEAERDISLLAPEDEMDMIVGSDYLRSHRLWLAYARGKVFYQRPGAGPVASRD